MIIFLHGADTFRSNRLLAEMKNKFVKDTDKDASSLVLIDGQTATLKELAEKINTGSLFVKKRLVVIKNIFKNKKNEIFINFQEYLKKFEQTEEIIIIFLDEEIATKGAALKADYKILFNFLNKQKFVQEFKPLNNQQLLAFIKKEAALYKKEFAINAANRLILASNGDLWTIASEIKKLSFYSQAGIIIEKDVQELCACIINEDIFSLTDALGAKNKKLALSLLEKQYAAGLSDEYLISMLIRQFKILLQIKNNLISGVKAEKMAEKIKLHPYVIKKSLSQANNFSENSLLKIFNKLISLDFANKTGNNQIKTELMLLISQL